MKYICLTFICLLGLVSAFADETDAGSFSSYRDGKRYEFFIKRINVEKSPKWDSTAPYPPLSPRQAIATAKTSLEKYISDASEWNLSEISLRPIANSWIYLISFLAPHPQGQVDGIVSSLSIPVLFDGTTPAPIIDEYKMQP